MAFVERTPQGAIKGVYVQRQPGYAEEELEDDAAEVVAFREGRPSGIADARRRAFESAMAYGNAITAKVAGTYSDAEARTWPIQEDEARIVVTGGTLPEYALIPQLAADKGEDVEVYAARVVDRADTFRAIVRAAISLRRGAEGLLSEGITTTEALDAAVEALRAQTHAAAAQLGLSL